MLKKIVIYLICIFLIFSVCGCKNTKNAYIYFELPETPVTLDPQIASDDSELIIIKNIFEGLLRKNENGIIICGAAEKYDINGLTYTFTIRDGAKWSNGEDLTAFDFEFALQRAVLPETKAPFASRLFSIKGAKSIYNGKSNINSLGVKAIDGKTLSIILENNDSEFLNTLTTSVAMPCNKSFFEDCAGKYGLFSDNIISNGSYRLARWRKDPFGIRLYRNTDYTGKIPANNAAVFLTCDKDESAIERLKKNSVDMAFIGSAQKTQAENAGLNTKEFENICWVLTIGDEFSYNMRKSLSMLVGGEVYAGSLPEGYTVANSLFPTILNSKDSVLTGTTVYDPENSKKLFMNEISKLSNGKFPSDVVLYYYDDGFIKNTVTDIVGHWQSKLSAFVNIESVSSSKLLISQLVDHSYPMAIFPVSADSAQINEYLKKFGFDYKNESLNTVQKNLLKSNNIIPLFFQNTNIAYSTALNNVIFEYSNGYIDFAFIIKEED